MTLAAGSRRFVFWMAHLALVVLVVQIVAIDHWHGDTGEATKAAHTRHCHGTSASCADGAALTPTNLASALTVLPPEPRLFNDAPSRVHPADALLDAPIEPPRAA
jgi:hypothetical protein